jgi:hypothetical protein
MMKTISFLAIALTVFFSSIPASAQSCVTPASGLVGWWRAEGNGSDQTHYANHGTLQGGVSYVTGHVGQSFHFNGTNSNVLIPQSTNLNVRSLTIEAWIWPSDVSTPRPIVEYAATNGSAGVHLWVGSGWNSTIPGAVYANLRSTTGQDLSFASAGGVVASNTWQHVALTYDHTNGYARLYVNGAQVASTFLGNNFTPATALPVNLGCRPPDSAEFATRGARYLGRMDEVAIYNVALSQTDLAAIYTAGVAGKCVPQSCVTPASGIVGWWRAEGNGNDQTHYANQGTLQGGVSYVVGQVGQSFHFNGTNSNVLVPQSASLNVRSLTIEAWIRPFDVSSPRPIVEYAATNGSAGVHFWVGSGWNSTIPGALYANIRSTTGQDRSFASAGGVVASNTWQHVALTYDHTNGYARLYVNGSQVASTFIGNSFTPATALPVNFGCRPPDSAEFATKGTRYLGRMDEIGIYNRALTEPELAAIYAANEAGKCAISPYFITTSPLPPATVGGSYSTTISAAGASPFSFSVVANSLPLGLTLSNDGLISGVPQIAGTYSFTLQVVDATNGVAQAPFQLSVVGCTTLPDGAVAWWAAEGSGNDLINTNDGALTNITFQSGKVGQAFRFSTNGQVTAKASASLGVSNFTIEAWINPDDVSSQRPLFEYGTDGSPAGVHFWLGDGGAVVVPGALYANIRDTNGGSHSFGTSSGILSTGQWQHVALTFSKTNGIGRIFRNGTLVREANLGTNFTPATAFPLNLGYRPIGSLDGGNGWRYKGLMDEVTVYNRALTTNEIAAIYNATGAGKCNAVAPRIAAQPSSQTAFIGETIALSVSAVGTLPLSYQWRFNETNQVAGATSATLTLTNLQIQNAGTYSVVVSNQFGSATSSNAVLNVVMPPATVRIVSTTAMAGDSVVVPIVLVANGNEAALGFNISFPTQQVTYASVTLGSGASGATMLPNVSQVTNGRLGIALAMPSGTFNAGTQEIVRVQFQSSVANSSNIAHIRFTNAPIVTQVSDANSQPLPAIYSNGTITFARTEFEADVTPRPSGDYTVSITDWVQVGRYAAGLDTPVGAEFQRADCAPLAGRGDGRIKATDWVQAGRFAAGLDPVTILGGPTTPADNIAALKTPIAYASDGREIQVSAASSVPGVPVSIPVTLQAQGNETALGFSVTFDSTKLSFIGTAPGGSVIPGSTLHVNTNQTNSGSVGVLFSLPSGSTFSAGANQLVTISLMPVTTGTVALAFSDSPIPKVVSDAAANELTTSYITSSVTVNPVPALDVNLSGTNLVVSWPSTTSGFVLQSSLASIASWTNAVPATLQTNGGTVTATFPAADQTKFFRLQHP